MNIHEVERKGQVTAAVQQWCLEHGGGSTHGAEWREGWGSDLETSVEITEGGPERERWKTPTIPDRNSAGYSRLGKKKKCKAGVGRTHRGEIMSGIMLDGGEIKEKPLRGEKKAAFAKLQRL